MDVDAQRSQDSVLRTIQYSSCVVSKIISVNNEEQADQKTILAEKFHRLADMITSKMNKFADDIEGYFGDAADAVDPKTLLARSAKRSAESPKEN